MKVPCPGPLPPIRATDSPSLSIKHSPSSPMSSPCLYPNNLTRPSDSSLGLSQVPRVEESAEFRPPFSHQSHVLGKPSTSRGSPSLPAAQ